MAKVTKQIRFLIASVLVWGSGVCSLSFAQQTLNVLTWEEFLSPIVIQAFENQTGIELRIAYFDSDEMRDQILSSEAGQYIDIALIDSQQMGIYQAQSKAALLNPEQMPNLEYLDPRVQKACNQSGDLHSVAFAWGTLGLVYRADKVKPSDIDTWAEFLNPPGYLRQHIGGHLDLFDSLSPALISLNYPINTNDSGQLREAFEITKLWLPSVRTFEYIITAAQSYPHFDQLYVALAYSGDQKTLNDIAGFEQWRYLLPIDGSALWTDCFAILQSSNKKNAAMQFLNFIHSPRMAALNADYTFTATPNKAALQYTSAEYRNEPLVAISDQQQMLLQSYTDEGFAAMNLRARILNALEKIHASQ